MQRMALLITLIGIIFLASFIELSTPIMINSNKSIENLLDNQKVYVSGIVIKETQNTFNRVILLNNNIALYCSCNGLPKLINKEIIALGIVDTYQNSKIDVLKIKWQ